uniref:Uncharacterized protein n=1 Tax=Ciona intestinalis TaxID=7719 RepID=H2XSS3_CIOIN
MEKYVVVHNLSSVKAAFKVNRLNNSLGLDNSFHCKIDGGCVPPMGNTQIPIKFQPKLAGQTSTGYFEVCAVGDISKSTLKCTGACLGANCNNQYF